jgi:hypothetical protein
MFWCGRKEVLDVPLQQVVDAGVGGGFGIELRQLLCYAPHDRVVACEHHPLEILAPSELGEHPLCFGVGSDRGMQALAVGNLLDRTFSNVHKFPPQEPIY